MGGRTSAMEGSVAVLSSHCGGHRDCCCSPHDTPLSLFSKRDASVYVPLTELSRMTCRAPQSWSAGLALICLFLPT